MVLSSSGFKAPISIFITAYPVSHEIRQDLKKKTKKIKIWDLFHKVIPDSCGFN